MEEEIDQSERPKPTEQATDTGLIQKLWAPQYRPFIIVIGFLLATSLILSITIDATITEVAGLVLEDGELYLPTELENWQGEEQRSCQNKKCGKQFLLSEVIDIPETERKDHGETEFVIDCPACNDYTGILKTGTWAERLQLPDDTDQLRAQYISKDGLQATAGIVLSGKERTSIHRPEVCLEGQGRSVTNNHILDVPLKDGETIKVKVLELQKSMIINNQETTYFSYYAYWFVGKGRQTHSHYKRMLWMATDRAFFNVAHRWAYISVSGMRPNETDVEYLESVKALIADLYPRIVIDQG